MDANGILGQAGALTAHALDEIWLYDKMFRDGDQSVYIAHGNKEAVHIRDDHFSAAWRL